MEKSQPDGLMFVVEKRYQGADLEGIGAALRAEWGLTSTDADEAVREFFEEARQ